LPGVEVNITLVI